MKIGIISDTHGCHERWSLAYNKYFSDADMILHIGDILYHGPRNPMLADYNPALLADKINACPMPVVVCRGNCDSEVDQLVLNTPIEAPYSYVFADNHRIVCTHGHHVPTDEAKEEMAEALKADIFINGHIHVNVLERRGRTVFVNPGSPALSKREDGRQTVAVYDRGIITIYDIDTDEIVMELEI